MVRKLVRLFAVLTLLWVYSCSLFSSVSNEGGYSKTVVLGSFAGDNVVLTPGAFAMNNTRYIIKGNCSLNGQKVQVGNNCEISLDGGCLSDGDIIGSGTTIKVKRGNRPLRRLSFAGTFIMPTIKSDYFEIDETTLCDMFNLTSDKIHNDVFINDSLSATIPSEWHGAVKTKSYTDVHINAQVQLKTCSYRGGNVFYVRDCHDVSISGHGHIVGDVLTHDGEDGESVYGIFIRNAENIYISGITCEYFWGDGVYIYPGAVNEKVKPICRNIVIDDVTCTNNRRQGISVVGGENITIKNSKLANTGVVRGTPPSAGIDIEPAKDWSVNNILIENCEFENNGNATEYPADLQVINNYGTVIVKRCRLTNFFYGRADNIDFEDCVIGGKFYTSSNGIGKNVRITKSKVRSIHKNLITNGNVIIVNSAVGN